MQAIQLLKKRKLLVSLQKTFYIIVGKCYSSEHSMIRKNLLSSVHKIDGWLSDTEAMCLYRLARSCRGKGVILEIGTWKGKSTLCLAQGSIDGGKNVPVYTIDPHTGSAVHKEKFGIINTYIEYQRNMREAGVEHVITPIVATSQEAHDQWKGEPIELLWIDGEHEGDNVALDFRLWSPFLIPGGRIAFHDSMESGPRKVIEAQLYHGRHFTDIALADWLTNAKKTNGNSYWQMKKNALALAWRNARNYLRSIAKALRMSLRPM